MIMPTLIKALCDQLSQLKQNLMNLPIWIVEGKTIKGQLQPKSSSRSCIFQDPDKLKRDSISIPANQTEGRGFNAGKWLRVPQEP